MDEQANSRARALIAVGVFAAFAILVAIVVIAGAGAESEGESEPAPRECVDEWNRDASAVSFGGHLAVSHGYSPVQVAYASEDAAEVAAEPIDGGGCVVVFAATQLDPEPGAAAQIHVDGRWQPLSEGVESSRLGELQSEAASAANAELTPGGRLVAP